MSNLALLTAQVCRYNCLNKLSYLDFNRAIKQFCTVKTTWFMSNLALLTAQICC